MDNVEFIFISLDDDLEAAEKWAKKESFPWPTILMADMEKTLINDIEAVAPTYVLMDKEGKEISRSSESAAVLDKIAEITK